MQTWLRNHRIWRTLALLAVTLILVMPVVSRVVQTMPHSEWLELCTSKGLQKVLLNADHSDVVATQDQDPDPSHLSHDACDYCALLHQLLPALLLLWLLQRFQVHYGAAPNFPLRSAMRWRQRAHLPQGPPLIA